MSNIKYAIIPQMMVDVVWPDIEAHLIPMLEVSHGEVSLEGIKERLKNGAELALCVFKDDKMVCATILGMTTFETGKKVLQVPYIGGVGADEWLAAGWEMVNQIARDHGCSHIRGCGRPGWGKALPQFQRIRTVFECEVPV